MNINDIIKAIKPLRNRMHLDGGIRCLIFGMTGAAAIAFVAACLAFVLPIPFLLKKILVIYASGLIISLVAAIFMRPGIKKTLKVADSLGLKERLITAYELRNEDSPIAIAQRRDALYAARKADFKALYKFRIPVKYAVLSLLLITLTAFSFMIPADAKEEAQKKEKMTEKVEEKIKELEKKKEELKKGNKLQEDALKEAEKLINELQEQLKKAENADEALKALSRAKHDLEELKNKGANEDLKKIGEELSQNPISKDLGQAMKDGNMTDIKQELEKLKNQLENLSQEELDKLAENFKKASEMTENSSVAKNLSNLAKAMASGDTAAAGSEISSLQNNISALSPSLSQSGKEAIQQLIDSIDGSRQQIASLDNNYMMFSPTDVQEGQQGNGQQGGSQQGQGQSNQQGNGNGNGNGQGQGNGQGNGQGQGQGGGGGAGSQTTNENAGYTGPESGSGSRAPGEKKVKDYESIYVPDRIGGDADPSQVKGGKNDSGISQWRESDGTPVQKGLTIPYNEVIGQYSSEAMSRIESDIIPPVMKDIVRDYFSSLE